MARAPSRHTVGGELRRVELIGGGPGCMILVTTAGEQRSGASEWLSIRALDALERAAYRLGFPSDGGVERWFGVVEAIGAGCLGDMLSEAIEEQETVR